MSEHERFSFDGPNQQSASGADEHFRDIVYRPGNGNRRERDWSDEHHGHHRESHEPRMRMSMNGCMNGMNGPNDPLESLDALAKQLMASKRLTPNMMQALQFLGNEIAGQDQPRLNSAPMSDDTSNIGQPVSPAKYPEMDLAVDNGADRISQDPNETFGALPADTATISGSTQRADADMNVSSQLTPEKIYSWVGQMFYRTGQFDTAMAQQMVQNGEISAQTAQMVASPEFANFLSGMLQGQKPTPEQIAQYLPEDLQQNIARDTAA